MKNKILILIFILGVFFISAILIFLNKDQTQTLISPSLKAILPIRATSTPTLKPTPTPIEFHFDKTTDLKSELEKVSPQVLDSDFSEF